MLIFIQYYIFSHIPNNILRFITLNIPYLSLTAIDIILGFCVLLLVGGIWMLAKNVQGAFWRRHIDKLFSFTGILSAIVLVNAWERWKEYHNAPAQLVSMPLGADVSFYHASLHALGLLCIAFIFLSISVSALIIIKSKLHPVWWLAKYQREQAIPPPPQHQ